MLHQMPVATLAQLPEAQRDKELAALLEHTQHANGSATAYLKSRTREFELRYEMTSAEMVRDLAEDKQRETAEIAAWLFYIQTLESHGGQT